MENKKRTRSRSGNKRRSAKQWERVVEYDCRRYKVEGSSVNEVERKAAELLEKLQNNAPEHQTLDDYFEGWISYKQAMECLASPYRYKQIYYNHIANMLGKKKIREITRGDVNRLEKYLISKNVSKPAESGEARQVDAAGGPEDDPEQAKEQEQETEPKTLNPRTVNYILTVLKIILNDAVKDEIIDFNPAVGVSAVNTGDDRAKAVDTYHRGLSRADQEAFMLAARDDFYYEYFAFLLCTGLRQGECSALTWKDINYEDSLFEVSKSLTFGLNGEVKIGPPKTKKSVRAIPMNDTILDILESQRKKTVDAIGTEDIPPEHNIFFPRTNPDYFIHNATANQALKRILKRMKDEGYEIEPFSVHALRDTFATRFVEQSSNLIVLRDLLGHTNLKMTSDLYAHVLIEPKRIEMQKLHIFVKAPDSNANKPYPTIDPVRTGARIRQLLDEKGLTVEDVRHDLWLESAQGIYRWLNGKRLPTLEELYALGKLLETPMDEIVCGYEGSHRADENGEISDD